MTGDDQHDLDRFIPETATDATDDGEGSYGFTVEREEALERAADVAQRYRREIVKTHEPAEVEESTDRLSGLAGRIIDAAGSYPGKYEPPVALSTHILNAVVVGLNAYVYDRIIRQDQDVDHEEAALLIAALTLHDANKFVQAEYDPVDLDTDGNSEAVLDYYFEQGDPFGIESFLEYSTDTPRDVDVADVKWLVQRTETKESGRETQGESTRRVRGLEKYCRIGDGFVSKQGQEDLAAGAEWLEKFFTDEGGVRSGPHVQVLEFTELEQSILNNHLLATVKEIVGRAPTGNPAVDAPVHGIILGSTPGSLLYLGEAVDREILRAAVADGVMERVTRHDFSAKTEWNAFEYDILAEIDIPFEEKHAIIAKGYAETLRSGSGTDHEFESVPEAYKNVLPELARTVFREQNYEEAFGDYPSLQQLWEEVSTGDEYSVYSQKIGFLAELLRHHEGAVSGDHAPDRVQSEVAAFAEDQRPALRSDLKPEAEAGTIATERFFATGLDSDMTVPSSDAMCFLCGRPAERQYKKGGDAFYKTQSFSRRVPAEGEYKRICSVCNLEHALLRDIVESSGYSLGSDIKIAFVYYDEFVGNLTIGEEGNPRALLRVLTADEDDEGMPDARDPELVASSFVPQYHLHTFYADSENARLRVVRELLETLVSRGFKVVIGKPFAGFRPQDALLVDLNPTRRQTTYGADRIESITALERVRRLFDILRMVAGSSDYTSGRELTSIQRDGFLPVADLVARESESYESVRTLTHDHFTDDTYHETDQYMMMREVAREGLNVYGEQYNSRYKKTKVFRLALDATLDSLNRGKEGEELREHVAGQVYKSALEEDYAGRITTDQVESFVDTLHEYLEADDALNKETLSRRRNALTNAYLFAYDQLLNERRVEREEKEASDTDETGGADAGTVDAGESD